VEFFFHRKANLSIFGPIRIAYATLLLINILAWWPDIETWFCETGVLTLSASRTAIDPDTITIFQWLPATSSVAWTCYILLVICALALLVGFYTRFQLICIFILFTSFVHRNNLIFDGEDIVFRLMAFYLIFSPAGKFLSIDKWLTANNESHESSNLYPIWPLRLIQVQTAAILFFSGCEKLYGHEWIDGTAIYYVSRLDDMFYRFPVPDFIFKSLFLMSLMTWATLVLELCVPIAVWFNRTRKVALVLVVLFHLSLDYMMNLNLFHWIMIVGWMSFVRPGDFAWIQRLVSNRKKNG
jgi:hypothetical protein